jgi:lysozyme family protein
MTSRELFDRAIEVVLTHEGETYTDNPLDRGGPTKFGIAQRWNPDVDVRQLTRAQAIEIYWERYWKGRGYEDLRERIPIKVFDLAVNLGEKKAITCLQRALRACGVPVKVDGRLGPETFGAARWTCHSPRAFPQGIATTIPPGGGDRVVASGFSKV